MGTILLNGRDTAGMNTAQANKLGIARTFQNIRLFDNMSVEDNVRIGLHNQVRYGMFSGIFRMPGYWRGEREMHERALDLLSIFDMQDLANHQAVSSSAWRLRARWRPTRRCCCWTNRRRV